MKANRSQIERALDAPSDLVRLILLYGPDEAGSRALADRLARAMGRDAERIDLDAALLKSDPARLADEAAAISLFGQARYIRATLGNGDEAAAAIDALLDAGRTGNPVVALAGALRASHSILKRALAHPAALAFASYVPDGAEAERLVTTLAREAGLRIVAPDIARRIASMTGGDRAVITQEIEKISLYLDSAPDRPAELNHIILDALGAAADISGTGKLVNAVMSGEPQATGEECARLAAGGTTGISLLRPVAMRIQLLMPMRAAIAAGGRVDAVVDARGKAIFWKDKPAVSQQLRLWTPTLLATALNRLVVAERAIKMARSVGPLLADHALIAISRVAWRRRRN